MIIYDKELSFLRTQRNSLAAWINNTLGSIEVTGNDVIQKLSNGVLLCKVANVIQMKMEENARQRIFCSFQKSQQKLKFWENAGKETFFARDNAEVFLKWCKRFGIRESVLFESDGLVLQTQPRNVLLCLLEVARMAAKHGIRPPPPTTQTPAVKTQSIQRVDSPDSDNESMSLESTPTTESPNFPNIRVNSSRSDSNPSPSSMSPGSPPLLRSSLRRSATIPVTTGGKPVSRKKFVRCRSHLSDDRETRETCSTPTSTPGSVRRSYPSVISATTVCSRLKSSANSINRNFFNNFLDASYAGLSKHSSSPLDKRVMEVAKNFCKDLAKIRRVSEGRYSFGNKNLSLRIVRDNNVVVRLGGGWDTLEHFFLRTDFSFNPLNQQCTQEVSRRRKMRDLKSRSMTL